MFELVPLWYQLTMVFIFGTILGSFLDVFTLRLHTGRSINGRSRCLSCHATLRWFELIPVLSYLTLQGRCRQCRSSIPSRLLIIELVCGVLFVFAYLSAISIVDFIISLALTSVLLVIALYDMKHMIIPNELVLIILGIVLISFGFSFSTNLSGPVIWSHFLASLCAFGFYGGLWLISKGRWIGLGDAKLALPLGLLLGPLPTFSFIVFSFWIGAGVSLLLLVWQWLLKRGQKRLPFFRSPLKMSSEVPFAPFMIVAFLLVYYSGASVLSVMTTIIYGAP